MGQEDAILYADIEVPLGRPESPEPLPAIAPILLQRVAYHSGQQPPMDYPAELS
jgi:hypothetical protein